MCPCWGRRASSSPYTTATHQISKRLPVTRDYPQVGRHAQPSPAPAPDSPASASVAVAVADFDIDPYLYLVTWSNFALTVSSKIAGWHALFAQMLLLHIGTRLALEAISRLQCLPVLRIAMSSRTCKAASKTLPEDFSPALSSLKL